MLALKNQAVPPRSCSNEHDDELERGVFAVDSIEEIEFQGGKLVAPVWLTLTVAPSGDSLDLEIPARYECESQIWNFHSYRTTATPQGRVPTLILATIFCEATSTTETSSDGPLAV